MKIRSNILFIAAGLMCLLLDNIFDIGNNNLYQANLLPLIPVAGSLVSGLISGLFGSSSASSTNRMNMEMFNRNLEFQDKWNNRQLTFANRLFHQSNDFNAEQAELARQHDIDLFDLETQWNSYPNQRRLMEEAGLNPAMMFAGGNTLGNVSASNSSAAAHSSAPSASVSGSGSSIPQMHQKSSASAEMIKAVAGALKDVSSVVSENVKLDPEVNQLKENVNLMQSQQRVNDSVVKLNEADEQYKVTLNQLEQISLKYKDQKEFATINNICAETQKYLADAYLAGLQGETEIANAKLREAEASLMKFKETSERAQLPLLLSNLKKQGKLIDAQTTEAYQLGTAAVTTAMATSKKYNSEVLINKELRKKAEAEAMEAIEIYVGKQLDNEQKKELMPIIKESMEKHLRQQKADYWNPFRYVGGLMSGAAAAGIQPAVKNILTK